MWVTVYTDASYTPEAAGWAVWAKSEKGRITVSDLIPSSFRVAHSGVAEYFALWKGMSLVLEKWGNEVQGILVCNDCTQALRNVWPWVYPASEFIQIRREIEKLYSKVEIRTKWVKGHQMPRETKFWLNNWCDKKSREARLGATRTR